MKKFNRIVTFTTVSLLALSLVGFSHDNRNHRQDYRHNNCGSDYCLFLDDVQDRQDIKSASPNYGYNYNNREENYYNENHNYNRTHNPYCGQGTSNHRHNGSHNNGHRSNRHGENHHGYNRYK